jgi:hypothetical protein
MRKTREHQKDNPDKLGAHRDPLDCADSREDKEEGIHGDNLGDNLDDIQALDWVKEPDVWGYGLNWI